MVIATAVSKDILQPESHYTSQKCFYLNNQTSKSWRSTTHQTYLQVTKVTDKMLEKNIHICIHHPPLPPISVNMSRLFKFKNETN